MRSRCRYIWPLVSIWLFILANSCSEQKQTEPVESDERVPEQEMWQSSLTSTKNGQLEAVVHFGHMIRYEGDDILRLDQGVKVNFYNNKGEHASTLTSDRGEFNEKTHDVKAIGNVVVVSDTGVTLHTEELSFDNRTEKVVSNVAVMVTTADGDTLYGTSFVSNTAFTEWTITNTSGVAHSGVDLSREKWKASKKDSTGPPEPDSLQVQPDSLMIKANNDSS